jgi:hypothetical protein
MLARDSSRRGLFVALVVLAVYTVARNYSATDTDAALASTIVMLRQLRESPQNREMEQKLEFHPYVLRAEAGALTLAQRRAFVEEQFSIQRSDAASFARLAGHQQFAPRSLLHAVVPPCADCTTNASSQLFQYLAEGEVYAFSLLMQQAAALGLSAASLSAHVPSARASEYPRLWAQLAQEGQRAAGAATVATNFPAWGRMCGRVRAALASGIYGNVTTAELGFLDYFAEPIEGLDGMVAAVLVQEAGGVAAAQPLEAAVRRQQQAEVLFWDAIYDR